MALLIGGPGIVTDKLTFVFDPSTTKCYPGTGTTATASVRNRVLATSYTGVLSASSVFTTGNYGGITFSPSGLSGGSINFQINPSLKMDTAGAFTIDVWLKFNSLASISGADTISYFSQGAFQRYGLTNKLFYGYTIGPQGIPSNWITAAYTNTDVITTGVIQHLTFTLLDSGNTNFYSNAQAIAYTVSGTAPWTVPVDVTNMNPFYIGTSPYMPVNSGAFSGYDNYASMTLYSYKLYNKALSAAEVLQNHNAEKSRYGL
jgi:hypothetical protein